MAYNSDITYWRINTNNTSIAVTNLGTGNPTEQISEPLVSDGTLSGSISGTTVNGDQTQFTDWTSGQYLYYINGAGAYILVGQISTITSNTKLTLTATPTNTPISNAQLAASTNLLTINEGFYIRVSTQSNSSSGSLPNLTAWRTQNNNSAQNNPSQIALESISAVGNPIANATVVNIPFTLEVMNTFVKNTSSSNNYIGKQNIFPQYIWLKATVINPGGLSSLTMYKVSAEENITSVTTVSFVGTYSGLPKAELNGAGYFNV